MCSTMPSQKDNFASLFLSFFTGPLCTCFIGYVTWPVILRWIVLLETVEIMHMHLLVITLNFSMTPLGCHLHGFDVKAVHIGGSWLK